MESNVFDFYPGAAEIESWIAWILDNARTNPCNAEFLPDNGFRNNFGTLHMSKNRLVRFSPESRNSFYGIWQPALCGPSPLVVHLPGYGAELSVHPDVNAEGYNVLGMSPLGYWTPNGFDESLRGTNGTWPVLSDTMIYDGAGGYRNWLADVAAAVMWAWTQPEVIPGRVSFYGTSQGGGTALLLGSVFAGNGTHCVAADQPFLTNYPMADFRGAYGGALQPYFNEAADKAKAWHGLGFCDTLSHASRMSYPVLLTEGTADEACPPDTIQSLYTKLPSTKAIYSIDGRCHGYNYEFIRLACAWFRLYA